MKIILGRLGLLCSLFPFALFFAAKDCFVPDSVSQLSLSLVNVGSLLLGIGFSAAAVQKEGRRPLPAIAGLCIGILTLLGTALAAAAGMASGRGF